jgi:uncharacterized protein (TIGR03083 family)
VRPAEHLDWLRNSVDWYLSLDERVLTRPLRRCPGWRVETVFDHLGRGVGIARAAAIRADPDADVLAIMGAALPPPTRGVAARSLFADSMPAYVALLEQTDPSRRCATYAGSGQVAFWIRRDAIELALHASDIADALGLPFGVRADRAADGIDETIEFALPMALQVLQRSAPPSCRVLLSDAPARLLGDGEPARATISGSAETVSMALWGRATPTIEGDAATAAAWMGLIEEAFRGPPVD